LFFLIGEQRCSDVPLYDYLLRLLQVISLFFSSFFVSVNCPSHFIKHGLFLVKKLLDVLASCDWSLHVSVVVELLEHVVELRVFIFILIPGWSKRLEHDCLLLQVVHVLALRRRVLFSDDSSWIVKVDS
jgi:hypothetical protein